jgi:hypothetical protein
MQQVDASELVVYVNAAGKPPVPRVRLVRRPVATMAWLSMVLAAVGVGIVAGSVAARPIQKMIDAAAAVSLPARTAAERPAWPGNFFSRYRQRGNLAWASGLQSPGAAGLARR